MRIDKFISVVNLTKRRSIALDMLQNGVVMLNGVVVKPSKNVAVGDIITLVFLEHSKRYRVLAIPQTKSTPKTLQNLYVEEIA
ncbi:MAG: RNA-binding S4 domain-containing protein [Campylobacterales bacterium]|nr:RNA-binding S4 domain-containing protein [Campylobacterales bacterium]